MMGIINRLKTKPTIFFIAAPLVLMGAIPTFFYVINLSGGRSMYGFFVIFFFGFALFAILLDYVLVRFINHYMVNVIEAIITAFLIVPFL